MEASGSTIIQVGAGLILACAVYAIIAFERYRAAHLKELDAAFSASLELTQQLAAQQVELGRATRLLALDYAVTCALVESATLVEAVFKILQTIYVTAGWDVGVIYDLDPQSREPRCLGVWRKPIYRDSDSTESLRSGFGFPILIETEVIGVIELYSYELRQADPELIHDLSPIGNHIGQLIKRKRAEDELSKSKEERLLELERVRRRIATDLHDDVGSSLTKIALLSEAVRQKVAGNHQDAAERLGTVIALSNELVEAMSDIVWAINPQKDCLSDLLQRMRRFASDIFTTCRIAFRFHTPSLEPNMKLGASVRREVFLVFKESIHNIVKHSGCSEVILDLALDRKCITLSISDNGKGFNPALAKADTGFLTSQHKGGNGLASMRRRAREMGGQFEVITGKGRGTTIVLSLPLRQALREIA